MGTVDKFILHVEPAEDPVPIFFFTDDPNFGTFYFLEVKVYND